MERPPISDVRDEQTLRRWYWRKAELLVLARREGLAVAGNKPELLERIARWFRDGVRTKPKRRKASGIDWRTAALDVSTRIDGAYRNTQNVRAFMLEHAGPRFRFSNEFMEWMRANIGATMGDAVAFWKDLAARKRQGYREAPLPQNEYNAFCTALSKAEPGISSAELRRRWRAHIAAPRT